MDAKDYQHILKIFAALLVFVLGSVFMTSGESEATEEPEILVNGSLNRVIDGDTVDIVVEDEVVRVRLIGIDTPETVDPRKEVQCFGVEASNYLAQLLEGKQVTLEHDVTQGEVDRYGRELGYLILEDGTNVGEKMLREGFAYEYTYDDVYAHQNLFKNAEQDARDNERGLWSSETCGGNR